MKQLEAIKKIFFEELTSTVRACEMLSFYILDIPYKYYAYHPQIAPTLKLENISVKTFKDLASPYCKQSRASGRLRILKNLNDIVSSCCVRST